MDEIITLTQNLSFSNLDLLSVGITIAAIALLGFIVYMSNPRSSTNISFLVFCGVTMLWSFFNYISYQTSDPGSYLILWRLVIFLAFWHAFTFFNFLYVFPNEKVHLPKWYTHSLIPYIAGISLWALFGNLVFSGVRVNEKGLDAVVEKGILIFLVTVFILVVTSFVFLVKRIRAAKKNQKKPDILILVGALITFALLFTFNLILPAVFEVIRFIPLGAITIFPFSAFTAYAIFKHKTFKVKNLGSSIMAFALCVSAFIEIIVAENVGQLLLRTGVFLFGLLISIQFVKNIFMLEHLRDKLEDANERLKDLDKLKSEFVSLASHQLRSPLTVIKGYASLLVDDNLPEKQAEMVRHIYLSAQGMANVVEDFLNVTKIEQGGMKYIFAPVDIRTIANDLVSDMKISAEDKHLEFLSEIDTQETFMVNADGTKIKQVFLNLVDNSIKYTKEGFVKVSLKKQKIESGQDCILFSVSDSGIGITEEVKSKLFQKFNRGNGAALNTGGSGLGLYLAQEIIKAHKGEILIESEGLGKGSTFSVILPIL